MRKSPSHTIIYGESCSGLAMTHKHNTQNRHQKTVHRSDSNAFVIQTCKRIIKKKSMKKMLPDCATKYIHRARRTRGTDRLYWRVFVMTVPVCKKSLCFFFLLTTSLQKFTTEICL